MSAIGEQYLPADEAARELDMHRRTLNRYLRDGLIAKVKHRGRTYVSRREIEEYWARQEHAGDLQRVAAEKQARRRGGGTAA